MNYFTFLLIDRTLSALIKAIHLHTNLISEERVNKVLPILTFKFIYDDFKKGGPRYFRNLQRLQRQFFEAELRAILSTKRPQELFRGAEY
jgi:hypothetical protein